jgi:hypothetical protein
MNETPLRIAIVYPGNADVRRSATADNNRFSALFAAFAAQGIHAEPAVYHDDFRQDVEAQLEGVDAALVWVNPIEDGRDRTHLDNMLRSVSAKGVFVSAHPDVILQLGTKEVLYQTRGMGWGSDVRVYRSIAQMRAELPGQLASGNARVLKQYRGHSGIGIWRVQRETAEMAETAETPSAQDEHMRVRVLHAPRGSAERTMPLSAFIDECDVYFAGAGRMIDQVYQKRLPEGMVRCYLVHDTVAGFGHQAINALHPAPPGAPASEAPPAGPRLYYPPTEAAFQDIKQRFEDVWMRELTTLMQLEAHQLPLIWDCDFLLGEKTPDGKDSYVLCEINVSSVSPFPDSAIPHIVSAARERALQARAYRARR